MMAIVNIYEAKTHLSRLLERAAAGEEIIIAKSGKPVAKLVGQFARAWPLRRGDACVARGSGMPDPYGSEMAISVTIDPLVPIPKERAPRVLGSMKGLFHVPDDFNDPMPDFEALFYGDEEE